MVGETRLVSPECDEREFSSGFCPQSCWRASGARAPPRENSRLTMPSTLSRGTRRGDCRCDAHYLDHPPVVRKDPHLPKEGRYGPRDMRATRGLAMKSSSKAGRSRASNPHANIAMLSGSGTTTAKIWPEKAGVLQCCRSAVREDKRRGCQLSRDARAGIANELIHCVRVEPERVGSAVWTAPNCR